MFHGGLGFCSEEVFPRRFEELEDSLVFPYRRVCDINYDVGTVEGVRQAFSRDSVDARRRRGRHNFMAALAKITYDFRPDASAAADDDDFHFLFHRVWFFWFRFPGPQLRSRTFTDFAGLKIFCAALY